MSVWKPDHMRLVSGRESNYVIGIRHVVRCQNHQWCISLVLYIWGLWFLYRSLLLLSCLGPYVDFSQVLLNYLPFRFIDCERTRWRRRVHYLDSHIHMTLILNVRFVGTSSCLYEGSSLAYAICVCLRIVVSNTYCTGFLFCLSSSCVPCVANFSELSLFDCLSRQYSISFT